MNLTLRFTVPIECNNELFAHLKSVFSALSGLKYFWLTITSMLPESKRKFEFDTQSLRIIKENLGDNVFTYLQFVQGLSIKNVAYSDIYTAWRRILLYHEMYYGTNKPPFC